MSIISETQRTTLVDKMGKLLDEYDYEYTYDALDNIIDTWASNKESLLSAFKNHPNYIEDEFCIAFDSDYNREIDTQASVAFTTYWRRIREQYQEDVPNELTSKGAPIDTYYNLPWEIYNILDNLQYYAYRTVPEELYEILNNLVPEIHPHTGEKTSRVINRLCTYLGYSKDPDYNKEFAKYADSLSPMTIKRHTVLSLNPLDYLTMSFGNSWASCHTIDKQNKRHMPNSYAGQYSSGTISYMLDSSSMVFYTVDKSYDGHEYWTQPKINRQMFHYGEDKLVQGRLYPQGNDGNTDEYTVYRQIVQQIIAHCFNLPNLWSVSKGNDNASRYIKSEGTHYRDYNCFENCTLSKNKEKPNENTFVVGHAPICIECGETHDESESINCCTSNLIRCNNCGYEIYDPDDAIYIDGEYYCRDCCHYCECCDEYHRGEEYYIDCEDRYVCEDCLDNYYALCEECDEYFPRDEINQATDEHGHHIHVCDGCLDYYYTECCECGEYHRENEMTEIYDGDHVCSECLNKYAECEECGEWYPKDEMHEIGEGVYVCDDCYEEEEVPDAV